MGRNYWGHVSWGLKSKSVSKKFQTHYFGVVKGRGGVWRWMYVCVCGAQLLCEAAVVASLGCLRFGVLGRTQLPHTDLGLSAVVWTDRLYRWRKRLTPATPPINRRVSRFLKDHEKILFGTGTLIDYQRVRAPRAPWGEAFTSFIFLVSEEEVRRNYSFRHWYQPVFVHVRTTELVAVAPAWVVNQTMFVVFESVFSPMSDGLVSGEQTVLNRSLQTTPNGLVGESFEQTDSTDSPTHHCSAMAPTLYKVLQL